MATKNEFVEAGMQVSQHIVETVISSFAGMNYEPASYPVVNWPATRLGGPMRAYDFRLHPETLTKVTFHITEYRIVINGFIDDKHSGTLAVIKINSFRGEPAITYQCSIIAQIIVKFFDLWKIPNKFWGYDELT